MCVKTKKGFWMGNQKGEKEKKRDGKPSNTSIKGLLGNKEYTGFLKRN